jgi:hypothetical protein
MQHKTYVGGMRKNKIIRSREPIESLGSPLDWSKFTKFEGEPMTEAEIAEIKKFYDHFIPAEELKTLATELPTNIPYRSRKSSRTINTHMGQRKLLMSEIDFLTDFAVPGDTIVYAGAAPGTHTTFLVNLFKKYNLRWHLYDPRDFHISPAEFGSDPSSGGIEIFQQYYLDEDARKYAGRDDVLFISDIRTFNEGITPTEDDVKSDMEMQKNWVLLTRPRVSMLKFRLPYNPEQPTMKYLAGEVRLQAWPPITSSETRLIIESRDNYKEKEYNIADYDAQLFYHNRIIRDWLSFDHGIPYDLVKGLDSCYDCALEVRMWKKYAVKFIDGYPDMSQDEQNVEIAKLINNASKEVKRSLYEPPHGVEPDVLIKDKRDRIAQYMYKEVVEK